MIKAKDGTIGNWLMHALVGLGVQLVTTAALSSWAAGFAVVLALFYGHEFADFRNKFEVKPKFLRNASPLAWWREQRDVFWDAATPWSASGIVAIIGVLTCPMTN